MFLQHRGARAEIFLREIINFPILHDFCVTDMRLSKQLIPKRFFHVISESQTNMCNVNFGPVICGSVFPKCP